VELKGAGSFGVFICYESEGGIGTRKTVPPSQIPAIPTVAGTTLSFDTFWNLSTEKCRLAPDLFGTAGAVCRWDCRYGHDSKGETRMNRTALTPAFKTKPGIPRP